MKKPRPVVRRGLCCGRGLLVFRERYTVPLLQVALFASKRQIAGLGLPGFFVVGCQSATLYSLPMPTVGTTSQAAAS